MLISTSVLKKPKNFKMVLVTLILGGIFLAGFIYESYSAYKYEVRHAEVETFNLSRVLQVNVEGLFKTTDLVLLELQAYVEAARAQGQFNSSEANRAFEERRQRLPQIRSFKAVDKNGEFIADDGGTISKETNLRDREYFQQLKRTNSDELVISKPVMSKIDRIMVLVFARRLVDRNGKFDGVVLGTIPLAYLRNRFEKLDLGAGGVVALYDYEMRDYARVPLLEGRIGKKFQAGQELVKFFASNEPTFTARMISSVDKIDRIMTIRKLDGYPFVVGLGLSTQDFISLWKKRTGIYASFITMILSVFLYFLLAFLKSQDDLEEQRQQAIQASKLSSLGEMASGIAHEINNPLTIISTTASRIKKFLHDPSVPLVKVEESLDKIISTVDRIARITYGLRAISRNSGGDLFTNKKVSDIVKMTLDLCQDKITAEGIEMRIDSMIEVEVECREIQIEQVLMNLINNSIDALSGLPEKWIQVSTYRMENRVCIRVSDSGAGIAPETVEKMMMPFYTTKEVGKGTGLGLSISKGIIEAHHGKFYYELHNGHTSFVIELERTLT